MSRTITAIAALLLTAHAACAENFGKFVGRLILSDDNLDECIATDEDGWYSAFRLVEAFEYIGPDEMDWLVPAGTCVNGASIPAPFWSFIGSPWTGKYRRASVIHDHYVRVRTRPWEQTHRAFYYGMLADGVSDGQAKVLYYAVRRFGKRWDEPTRSLVTCGAGAVADCGADGGSVAPAPAGAAPIVPDLPEGDVAALVRGLKLDTLSLEEIDRLADRQFAADLRN